MVSVSDALMHLKAKAEILLNKMPFGSKRRPCQVAR